VSDLLQEIIWDLSEVAEEMDYQLCIEFACAEIRLNEFVRKIEVS